MKWNGCYSTTFNITRGTRQGSKLSPYLFNIFINQLLLDLNDCDAGVRIGDMLYNYMAYADDITIFSTNAKCLQCLIVEQITCIFGVNRANCDTSTKVGMGNLYGH